MIKGSPIQKPIFNSTERRRQEVVKKEFAAKAAEAAKEKKHLKDLILFGLENSSEPVIKNPVMRAALEAKPKSVNYLSDNYSFAQNFKKQSKNINDYKPKTPLAITPKKRNYWDATMELNAGNKGPLKLPELTPQEIERSKLPSDWDVIYGSMTPFEKGQWNAEKRREKLQKQKDFEEGIADEKPETKEPLSTPEKPVENFVLPSQRVTPVTPKETQRLDQRLRNTKVSPGLSPELLGLQKQINRNIDYVLGADQKDESRNEKNHDNNKEENHD